MEQAQRRVDPTEEAGAERREGYILGHSTQELDRLIHQARYFGDLTEHVLIQAGVGPGQRVLEVGSGTGDVTFLCARLVGAGGQVVGVDRAPEALQIARRRAARAGVEHVHFVEADLHRFESAEPFDVLVGRFILMYLPDPAAVLRHLLKFVKPGGIVVFQELDIAGVAVAPETDLCRTTAYRIEETFRRAGIDVRFGLRLPRVFRAAGLSFPHMLQMARVECRPDGAGYAYTEQTVRSILPLMLQTGVATAEEIDVDTLAARIRDDVVAHEAALVLPPLVAAWARYDG